MHGFELGLSLGVIWHKPKLQLTSPKSLIKLRQRTVFYLGCFTWKIPPSYLLFF